MYITTSAQLEKFCETAAQERILGVDTEFLREKTYYPQLCLIQVSTMRESCVIDPLADINLEPLCSLFENAHIVKVFHACSQDLEVLYYTLGTKVQTIFDTQVAAAFLGFRQQIGYGALVEAFFGVHLAKSESLTDWAKRPLSPEQLKYAAEDVVYLPKLYKRMLKDLKNQHRIDWVFPEMEALINYDKYERDPYNAYLHLKKASSLSKRQTIIAREVCAWRELRAAEANVPKKRIMSDELIVEVCRLAPRTTLSLARLRGIERLGTGDRRAVVQAVERGLKDPGDAIVLPVKKDKVTTEQEGVLELMNTLLKVVAHQNKIAPQTLAHKDDLIDFISDRPTSRLAHSWRYEVVGKSLERLLDGKIGLTIKAGKIELL